MLIRGYKVEAGTMSDGFDDLTPQQINELAELLSKSGTAVDQNKLLQEQYAQAQKLRETPQPGVRSGHSPFGEVFYTASPLAHLSAGLMSTMGGRQAQQAMGQAPVDPNTGRPVSLYGNIPTAMQGHKALVINQLNQDRALRAAMAQILRNWKGNQAAQLPTANTPETSALNPNSVNNPFYSGQ
jgi:hypothetical protein